MFLFWAMSQSYQNIWSLTFKWPHVGFLKTIQSEWTLSLGYLVAKHDRHRCSYTRQATLLFCREWKYKKGIAFFSEARRWGNTVHFVGMKCPYCYTFSHRLDFQRPISLQSLPTGVSTVEATPSSQGGGPTPSSLPRSAHGDPERRPTTFSYSCYFLVL